MTIYNNIGSNKRKTWLLMIFFILFFFGVSYVLGKSLGYGLSLAGIMLIISGLMSFASYYYSDKIVLSMSGAKEVDKKSHREFHDIVENLSIASGLPMPKIYVIQDPAPNAFATGRDPRHASIAATTSIPAMTLPKVVCLVSRKLLFAVLMKNCEPFVLGPAFAMASVPRRYLRMTGSSSKR